GGAAATDVVGLRNSQNRTMPHTTATTAAAPSNSLICLALAPSAPTPVTGIAPVLPAAEGGVRTVAASWPPAPFASTAAATAGGGVRPVSTSPSKSPRLKFAASSATAAEVAALAVAAPTPFFFCPGAWCPDDLPACPPESTTACTAPTAPA